MLYNSSLIKNFLEIYEIKCDFDTKVFIPTIELRVDTTQDRLHLDVK